VSARLVRQLAVLAFVVVAAWLAWRALVQPAGAPRAELALRVGSGARLDIIPGTPIQFDVYLTTGKGTPSMSVGRLGRPWFSLVRLVDAGSRRPLPWATVLLETPKTTSVTIADHGGPHFSETTTDVAVVDHDHVHHMSVGTSPETMSAASPGSYEVQAILESDVWSPWGWHGRLESAPVTVTVRKPEGSEARLENRRLAASARFYLQSRRADDATRLAEQLVDRQPKNGGAWMLLGDALDAGGKPGDALGAYRRALAVAPRRYEPPTPLYERIDAVMRRLRH